MTWPMLALLALAAARVTHLTADDDFPFGFLRRRLARSQNAFLQYLGYGMNCTYCTSVYAGAAAAGLAVWQEWAPRDFWVFMVLWWAFAGAVVLLEGLVMALMGGDDE